MLLTNFLPDHCCGGRTRTCDLQVMSLARYQLQHSAMLAVQNSLLLNCECKGNAFSWENKTFSWKYHIFAIKMIYIN